MIRLKNVTKKYDKQEALKGIDLEINDGECVVLIGPSGCGKSSLLKSINRMIEVDTGTIEVINQEIKSYKVEELRRKIGYCIQGVGLFPHLSVKENIAIVLRVLKWKEEDIDHRVNELLTMTELPLSYKNKKPHELSGGEAQRVGVCRALATNPSILLMDEPFGALDPLTREKVQIAFREIQKKLHKTVVFVTHDVEEAILLADRIALMYDGKILHLDTPSHFMNLDKNEYGSDFLGKDYALRLLKRYTLNDLDLIHVSNKENLVSLSLTSSVKDGLSYCLNAEDKIYFNDNNQTYELSYFDIYKFMQRINHA
ncbi:MAG: ABC transporter ATP-binding protein [Erysipelotrichaceae bacterium]